ncbi:MAG: ATP-binding cassette domain-containing protein [Gammaproteobacteria bacterium]
MIRFTNASKRYPGGHEALLNVNFHLSPGEMAFLTGHSGAGKSTFLKLIALIERPSRGQVLVNNQNLANRTVYDNVALPLIIAGYPNREIGKRVRAALDKVGLLNKEKAYPITLSGGEQQRVGIARAVVNKPPLLLADEPTGNLDPELSREIMHIFEQFSQVGTSVLVATHDLDMISRMPYRILELKQGQLVNDVAAGTR